MNFTTLNSSQTLSAMNYIMPKLPSFTDILNSFNERASSQITVIENTTNVNVKSILHNSNDGSFKTNQSIMRKQTKHVHFKVELEEYLEDKNKSLLSAECASDEMETILSPSSTKEISAKHEDLQNDIETVDLLTPSQNNIETVCDLANTTDVMEQCKKSNKPPVEILECITFKAPQPIAPKQINNNQTFHEDAAASGSKQLNETFSVYSNSAESIQNTTNLFNKTFYEEFINASSSSAEVSPKSQDTNKRPVLKDFESYLNERTEFLFGKDTQKNVQSNEPEELVFAQANQNQETNNGNKNNMETDFLDFGNENDFTFDSDDNMTENYNATDIDFM